MAKWITLVVRPAIRRGNMARFIVLVGAIAACSADEGAENRFGDPDGGGDLGDLSDSATGTDGSGADGGPKGDGGYCTGSGPPILVGDTTGTVIACAGAIASRVFSNSVCTCTNLNVGGYFRTRSFRSGSDPSETASGAAVGVNDRDTTVGYTDIGGTFVLAGPTSLRFGGYLRVGGDYRSNGDVEAAGLIAVARDGWVNGDITAIGVLKWVGTSTNSPAQDFGRIRRSTETIGLSRFPSIRRVTVRRMASRPIGTLASLQEGTLGRLPLVSRFLLLVGSKPIPHALSGGRRRMA